MKGHSLIKYFSNLITFLVVVFFFLFSLFVPFNQIFPNALPIDISFFSWVVSGIFLLDTLLKLILLTNKKIRPIFLYEDNLLDYLKTYFIFDIVAIIPIVIFPNPSLWQLLPLIKIFSIFNKISFARQTLLKFAALGVVVQFLYWFVQITHWISCGWLNISSINENQSPISNYVSALYWTTTTLTTVGYGDIVPNTNFEKLLCSFCYDYWSRTLRILNWKCCICNY